MFFIYMQNIKQIEQRGGKRVNKAKEKAIIGRTSYFSSTCVRSDGKVFFIHDIIIWGRKGWSARKINRPEIVNKRRKTKKN